MSKKTFVESFEKDQYGNDLKVGATIAAHMKWNGSNAVRIGQIEKVEVKIMDEGGFAPNWEHAVYHCRWRPFTHRSKFNTSRDKNTPSSSIVTLRESLVVID